MMNSCDLYDKKKNVLGKIRSTAREKEMMDCVFFVRGPKKCRTKIKE